MRLSRGRSTPTRRAMWRFPCLFSHRFQVVSRPIPPRVGSGRYSGGDFGQAVPDLAITLWCFSCRTCSTLPLLVAGVLADDHDPAVTADDLALVTDGLDARVDLHVNKSLLLG